LITLHGLVEKGLGILLKKLVKCLQKVLSLLKFSDDKAIIIEINSQTDFVAQNKVFQAMLKRLQITHLKII